MRTSRPGARGSLALLAAIGGLVLSSSPIAASEPEEQATSVAAPWSPTPQGAVATLTVRTVMTGLDHPWDVAFLPNGSLLVTQRNRGTIVIKRPGRAARRLVSTVPGLWVSGETGLMSIAVDPRFGTNRRFYICHGFTNGSRHDVRVTVWRVNASQTSATQVQTLVRGIVSSSGRHGGCRLRIGVGGALYIGTGDAARSETSRNLRSLGGKVLRVNRLTGGAFRSNPFFNIDHPNARKVWTYGHRNVQGLAPKPGGLMWSVEHGPRHDDEVNRLVKGADYGWQPGAGYDESVPMTNHALPGPQISARWRSGVPTVATSGATWLSHPRWGSWRGRLAVAALKDSSVWIMRFNSNARLVSVARPPALARFGRLRSAVLGPNGGLYLTTDNGGGNDRVLLVTPQR